MSHLPAPLPAVLRRFLRGDEGSILVFWAVALVIVMGLLALTFDIGRMAATQTELQSFADNVALAAAGELDGRPDAITRAEAAAASLVRDSQTFGNGDKVLAGSGDYALTFLSAHAGDGAPADIVASRPEQARYVRVEADSRDIGLGFGTAFAELSGSKAIASTVAASAVAGFELQACDVTPLTMCLPSVDFRAEANIGKTLQLNASAGAALWTPGTFGIAETLASQLDGLSICAGLLGATLDACLLAARNNRSGCYGGDSFDISADLSVANIDAALNVRMGMHGGIMAGTSANAEFGAAPNVLQGLLSTAGLCLPTNILPTLQNIGLPVDDCQRSGTCRTLGNGTWTQGRAAYVSAHYAGRDPHPNATTRYDYYKAEIAAQASLPAVGGGGGLLGGLGSALAPRHCSPHASQDPQRRLMVVAAIDCSSASVSASSSNLPVREFFEVFMLGPAQNGLLSVEIVACLGGGCGKGNTQTEVRDVVRLHR